MKRIGVVLATLLVVACAKGSGATGPTGPTASDLTGSWEFVEQPNTSCYGVGVALSQTYYFTNTTATESTDGSVNIVETWDVVKPPRYPSWTVTGNMNLKTRSVVLNFWRSVLVEGEEFDGTLADDGTVSGVTLDPKPGFQSNWTIGGCRRQMSGHRVGP